MAESSVIKKRLIALFLLGCVLTNYPILSLFNLNQIICGFPVLYLYMFFVWTVLIILIYLFTKTSSTKSGQDSPLEPGPVDPC